MRTSQDLHTMANFIRALATVKNREGAPLIAPRAAARLNEIAVALDGCARQVGTVDLFKGEIDAMHEADLLKEASEWEGRPLC